MVSGPLGGPRLLAEADLYFWISVRRDESLEPSELEIAQAVADVRGPDVDVGDLGIVEEEPDPEGAGAFGKHRGSAVKVYDTIPGGAMDLETQEAIRKRVQEQLGVKIPQNDVGVTTVSPE